VESWHAETEFIDTNIRFGVSRPVLANPPFGLVGKPLVNLTGGKETSALFYSLSVDFALVSGFRPFSNMAVRCRWLLDPLIRIAPIYVPPGYCFWFENPNLAADLKSFIVTVYEKPEVRT
jgi:hypothetical protein